MVKWDRVTFSDANAQFMLVNAIYLVPALPK